MESSTVVQFSQPAKKETGIIVHVLYTYGPISGYTSVFFLTADMLNQDKLKIEFFVTV